MRFRDHLAAAAFAASLVLAGPAPAQAPGQANFSALFPSIVRVVGLTQDGVSFGSGVVVGKTDSGSYVVTNYHVIADADASQIRIVAPKGDRQGGGGGEAVVSPARFVSGDSATDIAVLYVANFFASPVPLAVGPVTENLPVRAIGYPGTDIDQWQVVKSTPTMTDGIVSTTQTAPWRPGLPAVGQIQHTAALNHGMSGGPLMDLCGRVIAIDTAFWSGARSVNLSLSAADITPYLQRQNIAYVSTRDACDPAAAAAAAAKADQSAKDKAAKDKAAADAKSQTQLMQAAGAAIAVVAAGLLAFFLLRRRGAGAATGAGASTSSGARGPAAAGPPHGVVFRGVAEASGKSLIVRQDDLAGQIGFEVGRGAGFGSPGTSRRHARILWVPGQGFVLRDLGSTGGTRVNGREIKGAGDQPINLGDVVEFGAPDARYSVDKL